MAAQAKQQLLEAVRSAASSLDCIAKDTRLSYGVEIDKRGAKKRAWVGSVYWGQNHPSNDVEIAFDLPRLAARPGDQEAARLGAWFRYTVTLLENESANNHSGDHDGWFRASFKLATPWSSLVDSSSNPIRCATSMKDGSSQRPATTWTSTGVMTSTLSKRSPAPNSYPLESCLPPRMPRSSTCQDGTSGLRGVRAIVREHQ